MTARNLSLTLDSKRAQSRSFIIVKRKPMLFFVFFPVIGYTRLNSRAA